MPLEKVENYSNRKPTMNEADSKKLKEMRRYHFDATWSGETLHENDCMIPWEQGEWVRYADWKAERKKLIGALEGTSERTLADGTFCWCDGSPDNWAEYHKTAHSSWCFNARAILAEVKGGKV